MLIFMYLYYYSIYYGNSIKQQHSIARRSQKDIIIGGRYLQFCGILIWHTTYIYTIHVDQKG